MVRNDLIDALRGLAVIGMLIFHLAVDLEDFFGYPLGYQQFRWQALRYCTVLLFISISGYTAGSGLNRHITRNAGKVAVGALVVTATTYVFFGDSYVRFGILHFLACALFASPVLLKIGECRSLLLALISLIAGCFFSMVTVESSVFLPFGLVPADFVSIDYYPLFPWLAIFIAGLATGRRFGNLPGNPGPLRPVAWIGRRSLLIYLLHQPILLLFLYIVLS